MLVDFRSHILYNPESILGVVPRMAYVTKCPLAVTARWNSAHDFWYLVALRFDDWNDGNRVFARYTIFSPL